MDVAGRVALVTGGGTGLGRATALELAGAGVSVAVGYSRSQGSAEAVVQQVAKSGGRALAVQADISESSSVGAMISQVESGLGPIDILVNNAGTTHYLPAVDLAGVTAEHWDNIFGVNVFGAFLCTQAVVEGMRARGVGRILNVASNSVYTAAGSSIPYVVSKAAVVSLTQTLARALAPEVNVNALAPGWMLTEWVDRHLPPDLAESLRSGDITVVPVEDVARSALELITNDSITGQVVVIDRGEMWE